MRISVLSENTSSCGFPTEHGLSLYIETGDTKLLFDTGQSGLFSENAEKMGIDLSVVDIAVLSHGHYDHGGGLRRFLDINRSAPVYMSRYAFEPHYNAEDKYIGIDSGLIDSGRIVLTDSDTELSENMALYSCSGRQKSIDMGSADLKMKSDSGLVADDFRHEQCLVITENNRRILFSGCSHNGVINIVRWFRPDVFVGGFHFSKLSPGEPLCSYAKELGSYGISYYTCHCTGKAQYEYIINFMDDIEYISAGQTIVI